MQGLVSLLPEAAYHRVENIWNDLETHCGLKGIRATPYPHFSWVFGEEFPEELLGAAMREFASTIEPFSIYATGLGIFPGPTPVLYIPIVKTERLYIIHQQIWHRLQSFGKDLCPLYKPDSWVPHISLAHGDITRASLGKALQKLAFEDIHLKMEINNLSFIDEPEGKFGELKFSFTMKQGNS